jgi:hypothetical protein
MHGRRDNQAAMPGYLTPIHRIDAEQRGEIRDIESESPSKQQLACRHRLPRHRAGRNPRKPFCRARGELGHMGQLRAYADAATATQTNAPSCRRVSVLQSAAEIGPQKVSNGGRD